MKTNLRKYNKLIADETIEDYSLRYAPKSFRKFSELLIANTAIGSISFLALEAIGAGIALHYGFTTAFWAILVASIIIFITTIPISYYAARHNIDIDLITRSAGFGYVGSTFTSLIYASFSFIFFALEAAIMAQALEVYFGLPLSIGYLISSLMIIPLVFYGITFINKLQLYTQPIWLLMMVVPFIAVLLKEPEALHIVSSLEGTISKSSEFNTYYFGFALGISLSLIAQIGEQVDYLRFMPPLRKENRVKWWFSMLLAGPGWIVLGFLKQIGGLFLASLVLYAGYSLEEAKTPIEMYNIAYNYVFANSEIALSAATFFVIVSQIKINVTNAYAGSLAWSNFFSRVTHSHPGRVVWMVFNIAIALLLMELGLFDVLEKILGLYSNIAIAWIGAIFADLVINKPLGLSPKIVEFKRAYLYNVNPVGVGSMGIASLVSILAFTGLFGDYAQSYSSILAMLIAVISSPLIAYWTKGKYYIARKNTIYTKAETHYICKTCNHTYEREDISFCPLIDAPICSLCCSLDSLCHDSCKLEHEKGLRIKIGESISKIVRGKLSPQLALKLFDFTLITSVLFFLVWILGWMTYSINVESIPLEHRELFQNILMNYSLVIGILISIVSWWIILIQDSKLRAEELLEEQNKELEYEVGVRVKAEQKAKDGAKAKAEFLAIMSHEIRTPMNAIIGLSDLALQTSLDSKQKTYLRKIDTSAKSLLSIINDILDYSKMEVGKLKLEKSPFDLSKVLKNSIVMIELTLEEKDLHLETHYINKVGQNFIGDSLRLSQILINLLSNAVKFTDKGTITLSIERLSSNRLAFAISDTGIGIQAKEQKQLFHSFEQGDGSTTRKYGGTGLGLSISKQIVELMDGKIWVKSEYGRGTTFFFEIELQEIQDDSYLRDEKQKEMEQESSANLLPMIDTMQKQELLEELRDALQTKRPKRYLAIVEKMGEYNFPQEEKEKVHRMILLVQKYKYKEAMEILNEW
jgi:signal transduction histidine kinase/purine-cytosine permease-like protein